MIAIALRHVDCSQHLVVVVSEKPWHQPCVEFKWQMLETRLWRFNSGISGFYDNVIEGWDESSEVHHISTNQIMLFTLLIVDWTLLY